MRKIFIHGFRVSHKRWKVKSHSRSIHGNLARNPTLVKTLLKLKNFYGYFIHFLWYCNFIESFCSTSIGPSLDRPYKIINNFSNFNIFVKRLFFKWWKLYFWPILGGKNSTYSWFQDFQNGPNLYFWLFKMAKSTNFLR